MSSNSKEISVATWNKSETEVLPLGSAVLCLDCEVISNTHDGECPACKSRALLCLARILSGSLRGHKPNKRVQGGAFEVTLTVELHQVPAKDVNISLESLTNVLSAQLADGRASFHINLQAAADDSSQRAA